MIKVLQKIVIELLKRQAIKLAVSNFIGGPFAVWVYRNLFDEIVLPFIKAVFVEAEYQIDLKDGRILEDKLKQAEENNDQDSYDSTIDDILD